MAEYINSLKGQSSVPSDQPWLTLESSAPENQQLLGDLNKGKMVMEAMFSWIGLAINQVAKLMQNLHEIISLVGAALDESCI